MNYKSYDNAVENDMVACNIPVNAQVGQRMSNLSSELVDTCRNINSINEALADIIRYIETGDMEPVKEDTSYPPGMLEKSAFARERSEIALKQIEQLMNDIGL